jgi:tRNA pseudouridine38-40 synthase
MKRYFLHLAYKGFNYRGWQQQPGGVRTVQATVERCLSKVLHEKISVMGCGRTDAQVHASQYVLHFDTSAVLPERFRFILNKTLPHDISVFDVIPVHHRAHARFDAKLRQYDYLFHTEKQAFISQLSALYDPQTFNLPAMREGAEALLKYRDFRAYCLKPDKHHSTICRLQYCRVFANEKGTRFRFQIAANRFLRGMVRIISHRLMELGRGRIDLAEFERPLRDGRPPRPLRSAHPEGLYLSKVRYPFLELPAQADLAFERS